MKFLITDTSSLFDNIVISFRKFFRKLPFKQEAYPMNAESNFKKDTIENHNASIDDFLSSKI